MGNEKARISAAIREVQERIADLDRKSAQSKCPIDPKEYGSAFHALGVLHLKASLLVALMCRPLSSRFCPIQAGLHDQSFESFSRVLRLARAHGKNNWAGAAHGNLGAVCQVRSLDCISSCCLGLFLVVADLPLM